MSEASIGDNSQPFDTKLIAKLHSELIPLEAQVETIKIKIKEKRAAFKSDTGMTLADFDAGRRLAAIEDDALRHTKIDAVLATYNTLKPGEQVNWVDAMEQSEAAD